MASTHYTVQVRSSSSDAFVDTETRRSSKASAIEAAERLSIEDRVSTRVVTRTGRIVHEFVRPRRRAVARRTPAYTRVERLDERRAKLVPEGYRAAYRRPRTGVILVHNPDAEPRERYLVVSDADGRRVANASTTREASRIMTDLLRRTREEQPA